MNQYLHLHTNEWNRARIEELAITDPDFDVRPPGHLQPLKYLLWNNISGIYTKAITILLDRGARVNPVLRDRGARVNPVGQEHGTLDYATTREDVNLLIRYGADVNHVRYPYGSEVTTALCDAGYATWSYRKPTVLRMILAWERVAEDLARLVVELTQ